jgi:uncharacterized protein (DUF2164 family)
MEQLIPVWLLIAMFVLGFIAGVLLSFKLISDYYYDQYKTLSSRISILEKLNEAEQEIKKLKKDKEEMK